MNGSIHTPAAAPPSPLAANAERSGPGAADPRGGLAPTLIFSFGAHLGLALISIVMVPIYLKLLGREGYGLFGFYAVLQSWMLLFDVGLSPAVARQLSRYKAGVLNAAEAAGLMKAAEGLFLLTGAAVALAFLLFSGVVARRWLGHSDLPPREVNLALQFAGGMLAARWMAALYQTALVGLEHQISLNVLSLSFALLRAGCVVAGLIYIASTPVTFFAVQAVTTLLEAAAYRLLLFQRMPKVASGQKAHWGLLTNELRFAGGLALSSALATMIFQADKLTLSHVLTLAEFGVFSLVMSVCSGIALVVPPFAQAFQPRLTTLLAQGRRAEFVLVYRLSLALISVLVLAMAGVIAAQPEMVLFAWTGHRDLAIELAPILTLYAAGTGISAFLFAPFFLQFAHGVIRLHVIGNIVFGVVWVPAIVWSAVTHGALGAGAAWLIGNLMYLIIWTPVVHRRFLSKAERRGLGVDLWLRGLVFGALLAATRGLHPGEFDRFASLLVLATISLIVAVLGVISSPMLRRAILDFIPKRPRLV